MVAMSLWLRNILFTVVVPGLGGVLIPWWILAHSHATLDPAAWYAVDVIVLGAALYFWCLWAFAIFGRGTPGPWDPPRRFVRTERYEGWDEYEALLTVELVERNGKTTLTQSFLFPTQELRDTVMKTGLTPQGMSTFYERLDALLDEVSRS